MNFLAHVFLSGKDEETIVGNFIADMISNKELSFYSEGIKRGVQLHRKIDHYTDGHPVVLKGVRRLYSKHRKYAPAIIDVYYDYLLANHWKEYADEPIEEFTQQVYTILMDHLDLMPDSWRRSLPNMIADNWLVRYREIYGMKRAFGGMRRRVSKPEWLEGVEDTLNEQLPDLTKEFHLFFPEVIQFVNTELKNLKSN